MRVIARAKCLFTNHNHGWDWVWYPSGVVQCHRCGALRPSPNRLLWHPVRMRETELYCRTKKGYVILDLNFWNSVVWIAPRVYAPLKYFFVARRTYSRALAMFCRFAAARGWMVPVDGQYVSLRTMYAWWKNGKFKLESKDDYKKRYPEE